MELSVSLALLMIGASQSVSPPPPQRKDAATVSAGISKEQLAAAQSMNDVLAVAEHAQRARDSVAAIRQYEKAGDMARSEKLLAEHSAADFVRRGS
jgi:hypothetical protein